MKTLLKILVLATVSFGLTGCAAGFNSIETVEGSDAYILTKDQAGFMRSYGEMWQCKPMANPAQMQCRKLSGD